MVKEGVEKHIEKEFVAEIMIADGSAMHFTKFSFKPNLTLCVSLMSSEISTKDHFFQKTTKN